MKLLQRIAIGIVSLAFVIAPVLIAPKPADAAVRVRGYVTQRGTYVAPHYRSDPDSTRINNFSTTGNRNPFTGKVGTRRY